MELLDVGLVSRNGTFNQQHIFLFLLESIEEVQRERKKIVEGRAALISYQSKKTIVYEGRISSGSEDFL